jgi:hypothetical protein
VHDLRRHPFTEHLRLSAHAKKSWQKNLLLDQFDSIRRVLLELKKYFASRFRHIKSIPASADNGTRQ